MTAKKRILLVDDELLVREELGALLQDEGYEVTTAGDGEEGLALFRRVQPDFVITDVRMPRRDGLSLAITIRQECPSVPVTVITGHGSEAMAIEALRAGVTDFIKKPVRLESLTAALERMASARQPLDLGFKEELAAVRLESCVWTYSLGTSVRAIPPFVDMLLQKISEGIKSAVMLELKLALRELLINAVEHGNLEISFAEKAQALEGGQLDALLAERAGQRRLRERRVTVIACREDLRLTVRIADQGQGFDWSKLPDPTDPTHLLSMHGRGVLLAKLSVDALTYNSAGNEVSISKTL